jgi:hypothetical protein
MDKEKEQRTKISEVAGLCYRCGKETNLILDTLFICGEHYHQEADQEGFTFKTKSEPPMLRKGK